jgi:hypothetical protein
VVRRRILAVAGDSIGEMLQWPGSLGGESPKYAEKIHIWDHGVSPANRSGMPHRAELTTTIEQ